ncbi:hypothetical protein TNCV_4035161 [Trichonephila clavipes]|nr:hypothetical protein TNCV_4035161 [Trichonephila clavipes]
MVDNAQPHRAFVVSEHLKSEDITQIDMPPKSSDLNPIEHVCKALRRQISMPLISPQTHQELKRALSDEWHAIPQVLINTLIKSMKDVMYAYLTEEDRMSKTSIWQGAAGQVLQRQKSTRHELQK